MILFKFDIYGLFVLTVTTSHEHISIANANNVKTERQKIKVGSELKIAEFQLVNIKCVNIKHIGVSLMVICYIIIAHIFRA